MATQRITNRLAQYGFKKVYDSINQHGIKRGVNTMGLDGFIQHCARLSAGTGAITGIGGTLSLLVGLPFDVLNNITQQFRVTLAVIYDRKGNYEVEFDEFMSIVAVSLGIEVGLVMTRSLLENIAERLLIRMGAKAGGRLIPVAGAFIGATTNYLFIKSIGVSVKSLPL
jgi:hypothetical protein